MSELIKKLAKINNFQLTIKERGVLMFNLHVSYEDSLSQDIGALCLDEYNKETKKIIGTAYGCEMIRQLMLTLDVEDFNDAKNKIIWVVGEGDGFQFKPKGIQTLYVYGDVKKLIFNDVYEMFNPKTKKDESDNE